MVEDHQTTAEVIRELMDDPETGGAFTRAFFVLHFSADAVDSLWYARRAAGLTQADVARRMGRQQPAIARWERDADGSMSLHTYAEIAASMGLVACVRLVSIDQFKAEFFRGNASS